MTTLYKDHEALDSLILKLKNPGWDEVVLFTYFIGTSAKLNELYNLLPNHPHKIYVGTNQHVERDSRAACLDVLLTHPKLKIYLLTDCHAKVWSLRKKTKWESYTGSYNLCPTHSTQITIHTTNPTHLSIPLHPLKPVLPFSNAAFAGVPINLHPSLKRVLPV